MLSKITGFVSKYAIVGLAGALLVTSAGLLITRDRLSDAKTELKAEKTGRAADRLAFEKAAAEAFTKVLIKKNQIEEQYREKAEQADASYGVLYDKYNANLMRRYETARSQGGGTYLPGPAQGTQGANGPGGSPFIPEGYFLISLRDGDICAVNTARLQVSRDWALEIQKVK